MDEQEPVHARRARLIAEMHTQANSSIEFRASERRATIAKIARRIRWQKMRAALFVALVIVWGLICVAAVTGMLAIAI